MCRISKIFCFLLHHVLPSFCLSLSLSSISTGTNYNVTQATLITGAHNLNASIVPLVPPEDWAWAWEEGDTFYYKESYHSGRSIFYYAGRVDAAGRLVGRYTMGGRNSTGTFKWTRKTNSSSYTSSFPSSSSPAAIAAAVAEAAKAAEARRLEEAAAAETVAAAAVTEISEAAMYLYTLSAAQAGSIQALGGQAPAITYVETLCVTFKTAMYGSVHPDAPSPTEAEEKEEKEANGGKKGMEERDGADVADVDGAGGEGGAGVGAGFRLRRFIALMNNETDNTPVLEGATALYTSIATHIERVVAACRGSKGCSITTRREVGRFVDEVCEGFKASVHGAGADGDAFELAFKQVLQTLHSTLAVAPPSSSSSSSLLTAGAGTGAASGGNGYDVYNGNRDTSGRSGSGEGNRVGSMVSGGSTKLMASDTDPSRLLSIPGLLTMFNDPSSFRDGRGQRRTRGPIADYENRLSGKPPRGKSLQEWGAFDVEYWLSKVQVQMFILWFIGCRMFDVVGFDLRLL